MLGADHPDTLTSRSNLAVAYEAVGDLGPGVCSRVMALAQVLES
ncbi:hypothetical protein [Streptomyces sp. NBC_01568]